MGKEIKFMAWDGEQKRLYSWDELCGRTDTVPEAHPITTLYSHGDGSWEMLEYSGVKDMDEKEVYEGFEVKSAADLVRGYVEFHYGAFKLKVTMSSNPAYEAGCYIPIGNFMDLKLTGNNIYQNPEVIKEVNVPKVDIIT